MHSQVKLHIMDAVDVSITVLVGMVTTTLSLRNEQFLRAKYDSQLCYTRVGRKRHGAHVDQRIQGSVCSKYCSEKLRLEHPSANPGEFTYSTPLRSENFGDTATGEVEEGCGELGRSFCYRKEILPPLPCLAVYSA
ncbi:hypothetical protein Taro_025667 [Colocasia esculenta]|uniref:Uncharacterized protein n=1 Tax=Colocasia esculenta TaxID=4460 RepID=A0A843VAT5_COLES|nr:hypothetical protein [Colocasia esculenta]